MSQVNQLDLAGTDFDVTIKAKITAEPQGYTYRGPLTKFGGGIFGGFEHRSDSEIDAGGLKTTTATMIDITVRNGDTLTDEIRSSLTVGDQYLKQFKYLFEDPETSKSRDEFNAQLNKRLTQMQKRGQLSAADVDDLVAQMAPYNIGVIHKLQLVVTKVSRKPFPGAKKSNRDGLYHRTVKSKQAWRKLSSPEDIEAIRKQLQQLWDDAADRVQRIEGMPRTGLYEVVEKTSRTGRSYKQLVLIQKDGTETEDLITSKPGR